MTMTTVTLWQRRHGDNNDYDTQTACVAINILPRVVTTATGSKKSPERHIT